MATEGGPASGIESDTGGEPQQPVEVEAQKQTQVPLNKKRKDTDTRSAAWKHYEKIFNEQGKLVNARCIYCAKIVAADPRINGTSSIRHHMLVCMKNPCPKDTRQSLLTLQPAVHSESDVGVLGTWKFDQDAIRHALCNMVIVDELSFKFVEGEGFKNFISVACPRFKVPSRWTVSKDCYNEYLGGRLNMKKIFLKHCERQRVSITTDNWTSIQRINYMCITAHYIDSEWKLHKNIISFVPITSHKGEHIAKTLENCLLDWGIKSVFTVTVDNASSNDTALGFFKKKLMSWGTSAVRVKYVHMRCIAHILNLVVTEGLKEANASVKRVREAVRYVRNSPARLAKFKEFCDLLGIEYKSSLCLDVPTRWNSTYLMLNIACCYDKVFEKYEECEFAFRSDLGDDVPDYEDWKSVKQLLDFLQHFYLATLRISGSQYVTANSFFSEISDLFTILNDWKLSPDPDKRMMAFSMKNKFDKYWGDPEKMNLLIFIATILDPRDKIEFMEYSLSEVYGPTVGGSLFIAVKNALYELFTDYTSLYKPATHTFSETALPIDACEPAEVTIGKSTSLLKARFKKHKQELGIGGSKQSEIDIYLSESVLEEEGTFDILRWWKLNSERFPILSCLARDVLAVPISTVASESAFSTGGRVLDSFRSSLTPKLVQSLICSQDWLRKSTKPVSVEEAVDELEKFEKGLSLKNKFESSSSTLLSELFPFFSELSLDGVGPNMASSSGT